MQTTLKQMMMTTTTELLIIGAGPAGIAAAETAVAHGLTVSIVDEQGRPGGQFLRQPPANFKVAGWLQSKIYQKGKKLLQRNENLDTVSWLMNSTVAGIFPEVVEAESDAQLPTRFRVVIDSEQGSREVRARSVLVAAGCYDLPVIFPGWNTPGVMSAGGIQAFIKSQQFVPGQRFVLAGSHPLQLIIAEQIIRAGGKVAAVLFAQSFSSVMKLFRQPALLWQQTAKFSQMATVMLQLRKAGVAVKFNQTVIEAHGRDQLKRVSTAPVSADGRIDRSAMQELACDTLGICFGFLTASELPRQLAADCSWNAAKGGWIADHDLWQQSSVPGLFVAGETTGVAGSDVAMEEGKLAATGCALELGKISVQQADSQAAPTRKTLQQLQLFANLLSQLSWPGGKLIDQLMTESTTLCKCEQLSVGQVKKLLQLNPEIQTASSGKLLSRVGMGLCQGRYCHYSLTRLLANARAIDETSVGGFTARFPGKPVSIANLLEITD